MLFKIKHYKIEKIIKMYDKNASSKVLQIELEKAFFDCNWDLMRRLVKQGAFINYLYGSDGDPLLFYCKSVNMIKKLVNMGADINVKNEKGQNLLGHAIQQEWSINLVRFLLKRGAKVDSQGPMGYSPLGLAVVHKNLKLIKLMLQANMNGADEYNTLLRIPSDLNCKKMLIKYGVLNHNFNKLMRDTFSFPIANDYLEACIVEVELMKEEMLFDFSLYDYLTKHKNFRLIEESSIDFGKFVIYEDIIRKKIQSENQRKLLLKKLDTVNVYAGQMKILDYDSTCEIANFLDNEALKNWITTYEFKK